jgi:hypothetical protein
VTAKRLSRSGVLIVEGEQIHALSLPARGAGQTATAMAWMRARVIA